MAACKPMSQVAISLNTRNYRFGCDESEAAHLQKLADYVSETLARLTAEHGAAGDERLMLMAALTLADELFSARADIDDLLDDPASGTPEFDAA